MRSWMLVVVAMAGCGGAVAGGPEGQGDAGSQPRTGSQPGTGSQPDASIGVTPNADAGALDAGDEVTPACEVPPAANFNQPDPNDMGCWSQASNFPQQNCPPGTYSLTCGDPTGRPALPPELGCGPGVGGPPHNMFYCCPCGPVADSGAGEPSTDASIDVMPAPQGLAGFALVIDDAVQTPVSCPSDDWEFAVPPGEGMPSPSCTPIVASAYLVNTGTLPMPYIAQGLWTFGAHYAPGVATGNSCQLVGVLDPGAKVDITSVYQGGTVALVGSAEPFSSPDAGKTMSDEGTIPWPAGVAGSGGASTMYVAQVDVPTGPPACTAVATWW